VADQVGLTEEGTSRAMAAVDLDNDGRLDLVTTHMFAGPSIYRNTWASDARAGTHWVGIGLRGDGVRCNTEGVGSVVRVSYRGKDGKRVTQMDEKQVMTGFGGQGDRRMHFGLGEFAGPVSVEVNWCGRWTERYPDIAGDRYVELAMTPAP